MRRDTEFILTRMRRRGTSSTDQIFADAQKFGIFKMEKIRSLIIYLEKAGYIRKMDNSHWRTISSEPQTVESRTVDHNIIQCVEDFIKNKGYPPTSSQISERYELMFGKSPLKDMSRHVRDMATLRGKLTRQNEKYTLPGPRAEGLKNFIKKSETSS